MKNLVISSFVMVVSLAAGIAPACGQSYASGLGINDSGQVVGVYRLNPGPDHAFLYDSSTNTGIDLGTLGGRNSFALGVNNSGQVVGYSFDQEGYDRAFLYQGSTMTDLGTLGGRMSRAYAINNTGQIVGYSYTTGNATIHAFLRDGGTTADLATLSGIDAWSVAYGINNNGQVVGAFSGPVASRAFLYDHANKTMFDLGTFGGVEGWAMDINDQGQVAGYYRTSDYVRHAIRYDSSTMTTIDLGPDTYAYGINNSGHVVGDMAGGSYLYDGSSLVDLNTRLDSSGDGWRIRYASAINDSGQITGYGLVNGVQNAYLLTPKGDGAYILTDVGKALGVPEPPHLALLSSLVLSSGLSFLIMGWWRRKRLG